jgi:hypothetical protein
MPKAFERTLTSAERRVYRGWVIGVSIFYGAVAALIIGAAVVGAHLGSNNEVAAAATAWSKTVSSR